MSTRPDSSESAETFWNGEPCEARRVRVIVGDSGFFAAPWFKEFVGQERDAVQVAYDNHHFYLDNEDGSGWKKVTGGARIAQLAAPQPRRRTGALMAQSQQTTTECVDVLLPTDDCGTCGAGEPFESENEPDTTVVKSHTITATFTGTQAEAEAIFDRVIGLACIDPDHHPLAPCNFMVGGMFSEPLEDDDE